MEKSSTIKVRKNIPLGFSMSTVLPFKGIENNHDVYRSKNCMQKF